MAELQPVELRQARLPRPHTPVVFHGTVDEGNNLLAVVKRNCECHRVLEDGVLRKVDACASDEMLARDQRAIDGLVFMRRMAGRLQAEELNPQAVNPAFQTEFASRTNSLSPSNSKSVSRTVLRDLQSFPVHVVSGNLRMRQF